ncbi:MAG: hypothetical protein LBH81_03625 [Rickettsiales bacterium]|nr:hypothetical protein [Rickettsiales bacterium]
MPEELALELDEPFDELCPLELEDGTFDEELGILEELLLSLDDVPSDEDDHSVSVPLLLDESTSAGPLPLSPPQLYAMPAATASRLNFLKLTIAELHSFSYIPRRQGHPPLSWSDLIRPSR